jgi:hypothetical protein
LYKFRRINSDTLIIVSVCVCGSLFCFLYINTAYDNQIKRKFFFFPLYYHSTLPKPTFRPNFLMNLDARVMCGTGKKYTAMHMVTKIQRSSRFSRGACLNSSKTWKLKINWIINYLIIVINSQLWLKAWWTF